MSVAGQESRLGVTQSCTLRAAQSQRDVRKAAFQRLAGAIGDDELLYTIESFADILIPAPFQMPNHIKEY